MISKNNIFLFIIFACFIYSCSKNQLPNKSKLLGKDYLLLSDLISASFREQVINGKNELLISEYTKKIHCPSGFTVELEKKIKPSLIFSLQQNSDTVNKNTFQLSQKFSSSIKTKITKSTTDLDLLFKENPHAFALAHFSKPFIDKKENIGIVYMEYYSSSTELTGYWYYMKKANGQWNIVYKKFGRIS